MPNSIHKPRYCEGHRMRSYKLAADSRATGVRVPKEHNKGQVLSFVATQTVVTHPNNPRR